MPASSMPASAPAAPEPSCAVFLVRHGERLDETFGPEAQEWRKALRGRDDFDPPLTQKGKRQAQQAARNLRKQLGEKPFAVVYSSPLQRCVSTAAAFAEAFDVPIQLVWGLGECCAALRAHNPKAPQRWPQLLGPEQLAELEPGCRFLPPITEDPVFLGRTGTLARLAQGHAQILAVSHRESIRDLVKCRCDGRRLIGTPYACVGQFRVTGGVQGEQWSFGGLLAKAGAGGAHGAHGLDPHEKEHNGEESPKRRKGSPRPGKAPRGAATEQRDEKRTPASWLRLSPGLQRWFAATTQD